MDDITRFLHARLNDDERDANNRRIMLPLEGPCPLCAREMCGFSSSLGPEAARVVHVGDNDPTFSRCALNTDQWRALTDGGLSPDSKRALAEVESKRRMLGWLAHQDERAIDNDHWWWDSSHPRKLMALPYADHDDYDERWRPTTA